MIESERRRRFLPRLLIGGVALAAFFTIGASVSHVPPSTFDTLASGESGRYAELALFFTHAGLFVPYVVLCAAGLVLGVLVRRWLAAALVEINLMLVVWRVNDAFKGYFHRPRPAWWYRELETSYAYASGHAALSLTFYGFAAYVIARSALPSSVKRVAIVTCGIMVIGIGWSRLALGAHYPTDLIGGYLLAVAGLCVATSIYDRIELEIRPPLRATKVDSPRDGEVVVTLPSGR